MTPRYADDWLTVYQGDCREVLPTLPEASVDCVVPSPPYWSLRDYEIPPSVWGGEADHAHEWESQTKSSGGIYLGKDRWQHQNNGRSERRDGDRRQQLYRIDGHPEVPAGALCPCGAWFGALGLERLEYEIEQMNGSELIIGLVVAAADIRLDGRLRGGAGVTHPGVEVSFDVPDGRRLVFHTDVHNQLTRWVNGGPMRSPWQDNLRAVALGLEALRAVSRYGITSGIGEQYAGFLKMETSQASPDRGRELVEEAGGIRQALMKHHPDQGGDPRRFADVQAYRQLTGGAT